ncbi:hypothetical protein, partial [Flavobacterium psychrophilum]|uniref:hypothetical protein n=1 Tax=Flavobacterium psychrophilum TaxID=96345 RepID=UPI0015D4D903
AGMFSTASLKPPPKNDFPSTIILVTFLPCTVTPPFLSISTPDSFLEFLSFCAHDRWQNFLH